MVTVGRKHRGPKGGGKQRKEEARSAVTEKASNPARTRCRWPKADPGQNVAPYGEPLLIIIDPNAISMAAKKISTRSL